MRTLILILSIIIAFIAAAQNEAADSLQNVQELNEIVVDGEKPQIKGEDGILVVDLPSIVKDKPVTNILEALGYLPGVVSNDGMIGLSGAQSVTIILNGELTNMPLQNLYQLLYSLPVDRLKNVEIMYSAPAKYHVSGAVINVVLKTPQPLDGLMGQVTAGYNQTHYATYSTGLGATDSLGDWSFDLNWNLARNKTYEREQTFSNHLLNGTSHYIEDDMRQTKRNLSNVIYASVGYKKLKLTYNGQIVSALKSMNHSTGTVGEYTNYNNALAPICYHNIGARYEAPSGLTIGCDYTNYYEKRGQNLFKGDEEKLYSTNLQNINRYHACADMEHHIGKWELNYGIEYQRSDDRSSQKYLLPAMEGFNNSLEEDVAKFYVGTQTSLPCNISFNVSAAVEYFHNNYRHNWNFVPQLGATYYKTRKSIFQLNLTTQRVYPSFWELHGGTSYVNDYCTIVGNPALLPYMSYSGVFNYIFRQKYAATLYMLYSDDYSVQLPYQSTDDLHLIFQTLNFDFSRTVGLQFHIPFSVKKIWNATGTLNISHRRQKASKFHDISFDNKRWGIYASLNNSIRFSEKVPLFLSFDATYITGQIQGPATLSPMWKIDAGIKWQFGKKRSCELDLKANDIFNTYNADFKINVSGQDYRMKTYELNRKLSLTFVWRFNGFKPKDTTVDTSRFGTVK